MGGSRANDNDRERVRKQITGADAELRRERQSRYEEACSVWNNQIEMWKRSDPSPALGVALAARYVWLDVYCHGCRSVAQIDLRRINHHPETSLHNLSRYLKCRRCAVGEDRPLVTLRGVRQTPDETVEQRVSRRWQEKMQRDMENRKK